MKNKFNIFTLLIIHYLIINTVSAQGPIVWAQEANFGGTGRQGAVGFSIGNKGYIGTGYDGISLRNDFWEYDPATNVWTQKANFAGTPRYIASGFGIGDLGYLGLGQGIDGLKNDFWEYNPNTNMWTQRANFAGSSRGLAIGFAIGESGYIAGGQDAVNDRNDFWEYSTLTDSWTQKANVWPAPVAFAVGFGIGSKGYVGTGSGGGGTGNEFREYDPQTNTWTSKANFGGTARHSAIGMRIGDKGYIGTGQDGSGFVNDFWEYDPELNTWSRKANFGGSARIYAVAFGIGEAGFIGTGTEGGPNRKNDFWSYSANSDTGVSTPLLVTLCPNQNVALGYEPQICALITSSVEGGNPPYTYQWNNKDASTTAIVTVCPGITTLYTLTVTDASGNTASAQHTVNVVDIRCGSHMGSHQGSRRGSRPDKVSMCRPGSPASNQCIRIEDVPGKLALGWSIGQCGSPGFDGGACGEGSPPVQPICSCLVNDAAFTEIGLSYWGAPTAYVRVWSTKNHDNGTLIKEFTNVTTGQLLLINAAGNQAMPLKIYIDIQGRSPQTNVKSKCGNLVVGDRVGFFDVFSWREYNGASCARIPLPMKNSILTEKLDRLEAFPNPFSDATTIQFSSATTQHVSVIIYNLTGQEVTTLFNEEAEAGKVIKLDFKPEAISSGLFFVRMTTSGGMVMTEKLVLQK